MKKTLIICGLYPIPENIGSSIRTMHFVRYFKKFSTVDIAYNRVLPETQVDSAVFSDNFFLKTDGDLFSLPNRYSKILNIRKIPWPVVKINKQSEDLLLAAIEQKEYDYILVRYIINTKSLFQLSEKYKKRVIIDFDDIYSDSLYKIYIDYENQKLLVKLFLKLNQTYLKRYEKQCQNFGASLLCSLTDIKELNYQKFKNSFFYVPNVFVSHPFETYNFSDGYKKSNVLLFVGTLNYKPNIEGLKWFIDTIFPAFREKYFNSKLIIIGRFADNKISEICKNKTSIELIGDVPDVRKYYEKCKVVVVPLLVGGGTRIKILEAACAKRPVLSTPIGAAGLNLEDGSSLLHFNNFEDFLSKYEQLLDRNKYQTLIKNAKEIVLNKYSVRNFNSIMNTVMENIQR